MSTSPPTRTRALVVSPTLNALQTIRLLLAAAGYDAVQYHAAPDDVPNDAPIALDAVIEGIVQTFSPDLLVLDIDFGDERVGWRLLQALELQPGAAACPWVVCIAAIEYALGLAPQLVIHGIRVVWKPFTTDDLLQNVYAACPPTPLTPSATPVTQQPEQLEQPESPKPRAPHRTREDEANGHRRRRRASGGPKPHAPG